MQNKFENCPNHCHEIAGIWDKDNGEKAGTVCEECLRWNEYPGLKSALESANAEIAGKKIQISGMETEINILIGQLSKSISDTAKLADENARLREAAEFYRNYADCQSNKYYNCKCSFCKDDPKYREALNPAKPGEGE